jgi:ABC-type nitrate/sulfonate/bicarbonate transport system permease component
MIRRHRHLLGGLAAVAAVWELAGRLAAGSVPPASAVLLAALGLFVSGAIWDPLATSLVRLGAGYALAVAVGVPVGMAMGFSPRADALLDGYVYVFFVTSVASLLPLLIGMVGAGFGFYVTVIFLFAVFHVVLTVRSGVADVDRDLVDVGRVFGAEGRALYRHVLLPASLPHVAAALRLGASRAVKGMVVGELWVYAGFGSLLHSYQRYSQSDRALAVVLTLMVLAAGLVGLLGWAERRLAPWTAVEFDGSGGRA